MVNPTMTAEGLAKAQVHQLVIQYIPATGQFAVQWPQADAIIQLGMLEFAKVTLEETRRKQAESKIAVAGSFPGLKA